MSVNMRIALSAITTASGILLAACGGDASRYYDDCRICIAVKEGDWEKAEFMLDVGANPNQTNKNGWTPLMWASLGGSAKMVKLLLDNDANPNQAGPEGLTALMFAAKYGNAEAAKILLAYEADPYITDKYGRTALRMVSPLRHADVARVLRDASFSRQPQQ